MKKRIVLPLVVVISFLLCFPGVHLVSAAGGLTRSDAVSWARAQNGRTGNCDVDGNGLWCTDLATAYMNYLWLKTNNENSDPWGLYPYTTKMAYAYDDYVSGNNNWTVIARNSSTVPQPGDIFVSEQDSLGQGYGHVGIVLTPYGSTSAEIIQMSGGVRPSITTVTWGSTASYNPQYFIRFNYFLSDPKPSSPWISVSRKTFPAGWANTFTFGANDATGYWIGIDRDGTRIITENVSSGVSYTFNEPGNYSAYITAGNNAGTIDSQKVTFTVWQARNVGDKFTAAILNTATGVAVTADEDNNVVVKQYKGTDDQLWIFERQGEYKSYKITNVKTRKCLDDYDAGTTDDTNIRVYPDNGADAQRWYLRTNSSGYSFVPVCAPHGSADMWGGVSTDGNNIAMWTYAQGNANQIFTIQILDTPAYTETFNGHKYELYNTSVAWKEAAQFCEQKGGHLVTITSQEEQTFVNTMLSHASNNRIWAGGLDSLTEGKWQWVTNEAFNFTYWAVGEPNNSGDEDCLLLSKSDGRWNDVADIFSNTSNKYSFICEYDEKLDSANLKVEKSFAYNGHLYEVYPSSLDWMSAKLYCEQKGGHLVTVASAEENNAILNNVKNLKHDAYWMGLTDVELESNWHWITNEAYSYKNWSDTEPNNCAGIEDYGVFVSVNGLWNDLSARSVLNTDIGFLCEYETDHLHILKKTEAKPATCTEAGNITYWSCSNCGKYYSDKDGKNEISKEKTIVKATGHNFGSNEQYCKNGCGTKNPDYVAHSVRPGSSSSPGAEEGQKTNDTQETVKKANPLKVKVLSKTFKKSKLKKAKKFSIGVSKAQGKVSYKLNKKAQKAGIKVTAKGKVTIPKKCKKGTYKITVKASGNKNYKDGSKTVTVKVK